MVKMIPEIPFCKKNDTNRESVQRQDFAFIPQERNFQIDFYKERETVKLYGEALHQ